MAEERINDIIAQEAFDQLASFGKALNELNEKMKEIIGTAGDVKRAMSSASGFKDVADATAKANEVAKEYTETTRRTQEVQSKMRTVFDNVVTSVDKYDKAIDGAREAMKSAREETGQLLLRVIDEKAAIDATAKSRKDHSKLLKESQDELNGVKSALDRYIAKEKSIRETIAATSAEMEKEREANGKGSERYAELVTKMQSYNDMLQANVAEQQKQVEALNAARDAVDRHKDRLVELEIAQSRHRASMSEAQLAAKQSMAIEEQQAGSINELRKQLAQYTSAYNALSEEERKNIEIGVPLAEGMNAIRERLKELNNEQKNAGFAEGSYRQLNAELGSLRNQYKELSEAERENADIGGALQARIQELDTQLKSIDKGIGQNQRNVGNYASIWDDVANGGISFRKAMKTVMIDLQQTEMRRRSLADAIKAQEQALNELRNTEGGNSSAYKDSAAELERLKNEYAECTGQVETMNATLGDLKDVQADVSAMSQAAAADAGNLKAAVAGVGMLNDAYSVLQAGVVALGADSQQLADIYNKVMVLQQGLNSVNRIADALQRESILRVKARAAIDKIRSMYIEAQTAGTVKQAAAETAETTATVANTAAEKANTAAKQGNAAASVAATAATGALAAGEGVATAASFSLTAALKTVWLAIKSIPVIGWILAAIAGLATLGKIVYNMVTAEKELTAEQQRRQEVMKATNEAQTQAISNTQKEFIELDRNVSKLHELKEGSEEYNKTVELVAKQLGVSDKWLKSNIGKVDQLKDAWKRVRLAQAVADGLIAKAADAQVKAEEEILALREKSYKERKKELREHGYSRRDARSAAQQGNLAATEAAIRARAAQTASDLVAQADRVEKGMEADMQLVNAAQKEAAQESERTTSSTINKQKSEAESALEYYENIIKKSNDYQNRYLSKSAKGRLELLEKERIDELKKYNLTDKNMREELRKKGYTEEQIAKIDEYYAAKRKEILDDESRAIAAAYSVQVELRLKMSEDLLMKSKLSGKSLTDALIAIEEARYAELQRKRKEAFEKEVEGLDEHSQMYVAVKAKYDAQMEDDERKHQETVKNTRDKALDKSLKDLKSFYETYRAFAKGETSKKDDDNPVLKLVNSLNELADKKSLLEAELKLIGDAAAEEGLGNVETIVRELQYATTQGSDAFKLMWDGLTETQQNAVKKYQENAQGITDTNKEIEEQLKALRAATIAAFMDIGDAFLSIGDSMKTLVGDSVGLTVAMQAVAMAQVLTSQGIAIAKAIEAAEATMASIASDTSMPTSMKIMTIATTAAQIAGSVAAILAQIASAKQAIEQSKNAVSSAKAYAEGTSHHTGGDAVVGEGGKPELVTAGSKTFIVEKPTLIKDLPVGAKVTPLDARSIDNYPQVDLSDVLASMDDLKRKEHVHIDVGRNVYAYIVKGASRARVLNKQFSH